MKIKTSYNKKQTGKKISSVVLDEKIILFVRDKGLNLSALARDLLDDYLRVNFPEYSRPKKP